MFSQQFIESLTGGAGTSASGQISFGDLAELKKALEMGYGTDVAQLTGGGAFRMQSLDATMKSTIQDNQHFTLFNRLQKTNATATVDEWTEQSSVGGFRGGSTNTETGIINKAQGDYARRVGMVKYLMTRREVSFVATLGKNIADAEAVEQSNGALQLLTDAEHLCFLGDELVVPTEFSGVAAQLAQGVAEGKISPDHVFDAEAKPLDNIRPINHASALIAGAGNFGTPTDLFLSFLAQSDLDSSLDPAFRVSLDNSPNSIMLGTPVRGIRTSFGDIATRPDVFIPDEGQQMPFEVLYPAVAADNIMMKPQAVDVDASASAADSQFSSGRDGMYYYYVCGVSAKGESLGLVSSQVAIGAGKKAVLTITASAAGGETGYAIYRSRLNGTNRADDVRLMCRIPRTGNSTTYVDVNRDIPGTSKAFILNMKPGQEAITWRQFLPMSKFQLYPTNAAVLPWAQMLFGYLRLAKLRQHVMIKNILPNGAEWRPFN